MERAPKDWNIWLTLMVLSAAFTILVGLLEALGVFHDVGIGLGFVGVGLTIVFGVNGTTGQATKKIDRRLDQMHDTLLHIVRLLELLPERLAERLQK